MLVMNPKAYQQLRDGHREVAEHFIEQAGNYIQKLITDYQNYKPGRPLDRMIDALGPKSDHRRTLERLRQAQVPRSPVRPRNDKRTLDELMADLGNRSVSVDAVFGRDGFNR